MTPLLDTWPPDLLYQFHERVAIKMDSHIPEPEAERQALRETWERRDK